MKKSELKQLIKEELKNTVISESISRNVKSIESILKRRTKGKDNELLNELLGNKELLHYISSIYEMYNDIHINLGTRIEPWMMEEHILPLMLRYRMNLDYNINRGDKGLTLRLFYH